jgi:hypothetical protein
MAACGTEAKLPEGLILRHVRKIGGGRFHNPQSAALVIRRTSPRTIETPIYRYTLLRSGDEWAPTPKATLRRRQPLPN